MKTDSYTKVLLSLIAACLLVLTIKNIGLIPELHASAEAPALAGSRFLSVPVNDDGSINVRLSGSDVIKIDLSDISTSDKLNINVEEVGGSYIFGGALPVEMED